MLSSTDIAIRRAAKNKTLQLKVQVDRERQLYVTISDEYGLIETVESTSACIKRLNDVLGENFV